MTTFSQLVDGIVAETKRPDLLNDFASYLNQAIREVHFEPSRGNAVFYEENYIEAQVRVDVYDEIYAWQIPDPTVFQNIAAVRFDGVYTRDRKPVYAMRLTPTARMDYEPYVYQRARNQILCRGHAGYNTAISFAYFEYPKSLRYYASGTRPALYTIGEGWTFAPDVVTDEQQETAIAQVSNWLTLRWASVLEEALRAKVYKRLSDETRSRQSYSLYTQLRQGLYTSEVADLGGPY